MNDSAAPTSGSTEFQPLYAQVKDLLVRRIGSGAWKPGELLPSEFELAAEYKVSQGTVRKAMMALEAERLIVRRQGRGTYVAKHDDERILFQFFKIMPDAGERRLPDSRVLTKGLAQDQEATAVLGLKDNSEVVRVVRARMLGGQVCIVERICLPATLFPGLVARDLPNNLYELYATEFGVTIGRASERLKAVSASDPEAPILGVTPGEPLLQIHRVAFAVDGRPVEWRISLCKTEDHHYFSDLR